MYLDLSLSNWGYLSFSANIIVNLLFVLITAVGLYVSINSHKSHGKTISIKPHKASYVEGGELYVEVTKNQERLDELGKFAKIGAWEFDVKTGKTNWTNEVYSIHELNNDFDLTLDNSIKLFDSQRQTIFKRAIAACLESGASFDLILPLTTANNNLKWIRLTGKAIKHQNEILGLFGLIHDITESENSNFQIKRTLDKLEFYKNAIDAVAIVSITDPDGNIKYVNDKFQNYTGYNNIELIGEKHSKLDSGHHPLKFWKNLWDTIKKGQIWRGEIKNVKKDGSFYWVETFIVPNLNEDNSVDEFLSMSFDVTERKVHQKKLEHANKTKDILLKELHHRVKNNLQLINSIFFIHSEKLRDGPTKDFIRMMSMRIESISTVHEHFKYEEDLNMVSLKAYVEQLTYKLQNMVSEKSNTHVKVNCSIADVEINIDKTIIIGLIINELFVNSFKYAFRDKTEGLIEINAEEKEKNLILSYSDNGIGIDSTIYTSDIKLGGHGIFLVKLFVDQLRGSIDVSSGHNTGLSIVINLPLNYV